jgi:hypothetical protein
MTLAQNPAQNTTLNIVDVVDIASGSSPAGQHVLLPKQLKKGCLFLILVCFLASEVKPLWHSLQSLQSLQSRRGRGIANPQVIAPK